MDSAENGRAVISAGIGKKLITFLVSIVLTIAAFEVSSYLLSKFAANKPDMALNRPDSTKLTGLPDTHTVQNVSTSGSQPVASPVATLHTPVEDIKPSTRIHHTGTDNSAAAARYNVAATREEAGRVAAQKHLQQQAQQQQIRQEQQQEQQLRNQQQEQNQQSVQQPATQQGQQTQQQQTQQPTQQQQPGPANTSATPKTEAVQPAKSNDAGKNNLVKATGVLSVTIDGLHLAERPDGKQSGERLSPKKQYSIIGKLSRKSTEVINEVSTEDYWYMISDSKGKQGWVFGFYANVTAK